MLKTLLAAAAILLPIAAFADEIHCPDGAPSCKVITVTPQEEQSLTSQGAILDAAEYANKMGLSGPVTYWRNKLATAPAGKVEEKKK